MNYDVLIVGGGPAGMCAALAAKAEGSTVALIERDYVLGGILNQCIHNGFGLHYFNEELTGTEYANRLCTLIDKAGVDVYLDTMVLSVGTDKTIKAVNAKDGILLFSAKAIILAMGCRERSAGAILLCGTRPAGVYTAGLAQKLCNQKGYLVGKKIVILGSGDIGLIMARRMTFEGAKVEAVVELMPYSSGLKRNIVQCLDDYNIPVYYSHTITKVLGEGRVSGVKIAPVDDKLCPIFNEEWTLECDCLLLSVGLLPENDLIRNIGIDFSAVTTGAIVDELRQTSLPGFFACGNVLHVHDLVDNVSIEGEIAGKAASRFAMVGIEDKNKFLVNAVGGIRYALPQKIYQGEGAVKIYFRVSKVYKNAVIDVKTCDNTLLSRKFAILTPGEMESITIDKAKVFDDIVISVREGV